MASSSTANTGSAGPTLIGSVQRALHLLDAVGASSRPMTAKALARSVDLPLPTVYHLLRTLVHEGYLRKLDEGYVLGTQVSLLAGADPLQSALPRIRPVLRALRDELHAATYLSLYRDGEITLIDIEDGPDAPCVDLWVGIHDAGHATAFGKCILSGLEVDARHDYLSRNGLADLTPHTITNPRILDEMLSTSSDVFADREEYLLGTSCLAAQVRAPGLVGSVAISAPSRRLDRDSAVVALRRAASRLSRGIATVT